MKVVARVAHARHARFKRVEMRRVVPISAPLVLASMGKRGEGEGPYRNTFTADLTLDIHSSIT